VQIVEKPLVTALPLLRTYYTDIVGRYHGRAATLEEVDAALAAEPSDDLVLLLAMEDDEPIGCVGLHLSTTPVAEVKRVFVVPSARGRGVAQALLAAAEAEALRRGCWRTRLDVRDDLVEARALYANAGYVEVEPFNSDRYAEHWFAKDLLRLTTVEADDDRLTGLIKELDRELWDRYGDEAIGPSPIASAAKFVLACRGTTPVGCAGVQWRGEDIELKRMFVAPEARGTGVAPRLVEAALEVAAELGGRRVILETGLRQPEAIRLYEKCGFTRIPNFPPYDRDPLSVCFSAAVAQLAQQQGQV
jgi:GNAT superfamily N-acetyltransferase